MQKPIGGSYSEKKILKRLISTVARGGTYKLNIGPKGDGSIPEYVANSLEASWRWIAKYPQVIYAVDPSPWKHTLPWVDITRQWDTLFLAVYDWPTNGKLLVPGLKNRIISANLLTGSEKKMIRYHREDNTVLMESIAKEMGDTLGFAATVAVLVGKIIGVFVERMSSSVRVDFRFT